MQRVASPRFVGRHTELTVLDTALAELGTGRTTAVLVGGEAGAGKSRLVGEFTSAAAAGGARVLAGGCVALGADSLPYAPFVQALGDLATEVGPAGLADLVGPDWHELARLVPALRQPAADHRPAGAPDRTVLFHAVLRAFEAVAGPSPLLVVVEDVHWADASSRELLSFLIGRLRGRVLLVATYRNDEIHRGHPLRPFLAEASRDSRVVRLDVGPLAPAEVAEQVAAIVGSAPPRSLVDAIVTRAEGNPFFAEELLAAGGGPELPPDLAEVLAARLDALPATAQELVRVAAVAGRRVHHDLLAAVTGRPAAELAAGLREATARQILVADADGYAFRHALLAEAAYAELLPAERAPLHSACATALAEHPEWAADPTGAAGELAHHYAAARDAARALTYSVLAAAAAAESYAFVEAHTLYEQALALWDEVEKPSVLAGCDRVELLQRTADAAQLVGASRRAVALLRAAVDSLDPAVEPVRSALLYELLGRLLAVSGDDGGALEANRAAIALMPPGRSSERADVMAGEARALMIRGQYRQSRDRCAEAIAMARAAGNVQAESHALNTMGAALAQLGAGDEAITCLERAVGIAEAAGSVQDIRRGYANLAVALQVVAGRPGRAAEVCLDGAARLRKIGYEEGSVFLHGLAAHFLTAAGSWDEAERLAAEVLAADSVDVMAAWEARVAVTSITLRRGNFAAAHQHLAAAQRLYSETSSTDARMVVAELQVSLALAEGRLDDARAIVDEGIEGLGDTEADSYVLMLVADGLRAEADEVTRQLGRRGGAKLATARARAEALFERTRATEAPTTPHGAAHELQCRGELARARGEHRPQLWSDVVQAWTTLGHPYDIAYAQWRAAEAHLAAGAKDEAVRMLREAHALAAGLRAALLMADIEALARRARVRLTVAQEPRTASPDSAPRLTSRELDVLTLVAAGHTNNQIAQALFITDKTASVHVSRILTKLGVSTRGQAAALARRQNLVPEATETA